MLQIKLRDDRSQFDRSRSPIAWWRVPPGVCEDQSGYRSPGLHRRQDGKRDRGSGYFEVDDAKCREGQYDIKLDKDFKVIVMTRD
jgi:hypothetical protein